MAAFTEVVPSVQTAAEDRQVRPRRPSRAARPVAS